MKKLKMMLLGALLLLGLGVQAKDKVAAPGEPTAPANAKAEDVKVPAPDVPIPLASWLKLFGEPSLAQAKDAATQPAVRLIWIRTFQAPISIRAYMTTDGPRLRVARMSGAGGYDWGKLNFENDYALSKLHWDNLIKLININFARQPLRDVKPEHRSVPEGLDGSSWILEVVDAKGYTNAEVANPTTILKGKEAKQNLKSLGFQLEPFIAAGKYLLQFAPLDLDDID